MDQSSWSTQLHAVRLLPTAGVCYLPVTTWVRDLLPSVQTVPSWELISKAPTGGLGQ